MTQSKPPLNNEFTPPLPQSEPFELPQINIRKAHPGDINSIITIENQQYTHPWKPHQFTSELNHDIAFFYVAEAPESGQIMGYIIFWVIEDTMELHNITTAPAFQGKKVGKHLLKLMLDTANKKQVKEIFLEVRASNTTAWHFYEAFGFERISIRKNYYSEPTEDAWIYCRKSPF